MTVDVHTTEPKLNPWLVWLSLAGIIGLNILGSLYWISRNVVLVGRDSGGHLERTLKAAALIEHPTIQTPFRLLTLHDYRPPLLYIATQPFYWLFGKSMDSAQLVNIALYSLVLLLTFLLGRKIVGERAALFATLLTGLLPMMPAMSRLFYMEHLLTSMLLLNLLALISSDGFRSRRWSLVWGVSLGLAMLTKWTTPVYLLLPTLWVLWRADFFRRQWTALRRPRIAWGRLGAAVVVAVAITALWYLPNRVDAQEMLLGDGMALLWVLLLTALFYVMRMEAGLLTNAWTGLLLGAAIASLWYFPRIDFLVRLTDVAFGTDRGNQDAVNLLRLENYTRYFRFWVEQQMGPLASLLILPPALWAWLRRLPGWRTARPGVVILWLTLLSTYLLLMFLAQATARNLVPLVPIVAILLADSLRDYARPLAIALGVIWVAVLGVQWSIYTFDAMAPFQACTAALWSSGDYMAWPATGSTDSGFFIQPQVLAAIGDPEGDPASFGMLVDSREIHRGSFRYMIGAGDLNIALTALSEPETGSWSDMLANQWVLVKDGDPGDIQGPGLTVLARILQGDPLFDLLYDEVARYPLPNGETAILYHRAQGPAHPEKFPVVLIETQGIADAINKLWSDHATLYFSDADVATWVGIHDLVADRILMPREPGESVETLLDDSVTGTILTATRYDTAQVQEWLRSNSYFVAEIGDGEFKLSIFGRPDRPLQPLPVQTSWDAVTVTELKSLSPVAPGEVLPVEMTTTITAEADAPAKLKMSVRLVDANGDAIAQRDVTVADHMSLALLVPPDASPGEYTLGAVLYDPATLTPIPDVAGEELGRLATVEVNQGSERAQRKPTKLLRK